VTRGAVPYKSCNVNIKGHDGGPPVRVPDGTSEFEIADCHQLPWLMSRVLGDNTRGIVADLGASDGECALNLAAHGHTVCAFDAKLDKAWLGHRAVLKEWVDESIRINGWQKRILLMPDQLISDYYHIWTHNPRFYSHQERILLMGYVSPETRDIWRLGGTQRHRRLREKPREGHRKCAAYLPGTCASCRERSLVEWFAGSPALTW